MMNGLLVLDKPAGMTSHDVVDVVRRITGERSIGHLGTLDPMATGVLPLLLGKYTRLAQFFSTAEKIYEGSIRFGFATDTFDAEGSPAEEVRPLTLSLEELRVIAKPFHGEVQQTPPIFSAKKIAGVPAFLFIVLNCCRSTVRRLHTWKRVSRCRSPLEVMCARLRMNSAS
jgi:tRNA pseudouridine55 synthase